MLRPFGLQDRLVRHYRLLIATAARRVLEDADLAVPRLAAEPPASPPLEG